MSPLFRVAVIILAVATGCKPEPSIAIVDVTVINPSDGTRRENVTVIIRGDRITDIGIGRPPRGATIIDGRGKFLVPGLWDMHTHVWKPEHLRLYVSNGITGIRNAGGRLLELQRWRRAVTTGGLAGPRIIMCGPILDGPQRARARNSIAIETEHDVTSAFRGFANANVDFVKVYDGLSREAFFAIASEARERHFTIAGHVPDSVTPLEASNAGMRSIEHLDGIEKSDPGLFAAFVENETWQVPTLVAQGEHRDRAMNLVRDMHKARVRLLAGTDSVSGATVHDELKLLVAAGLTPMEALRTATSNPAQFLHRDDLGSISRGSVADLVLLSADPSIDIANSARVVATIAAGRLYDRAAR